MARTVDGLVNDNLGWAIQGGVGYQVAAYETAQNIGFGQGSLLTFSLIQNGTWFDVTHTLGRFRLSVTTDDRSLFADGLSVGGDVTANWTVLQPLSAAAANGTTLTSLGDNSILASGIVPLTDTYTITAATSLTGITGIRLEVIQDPSLPQNGPGRTPTDGNFILSELQISITAVPEPSQSALFGLGLALATWFGCARWRRAGS